MDFALVREAPTLPCALWPFSSSFLVVPDHSAAGSFLKLDVEGFCLCAGTGGGVGLLGPPVSCGGAGLNGWATSFVVCPVFNLVGDRKEVEAGRLGLVKSGLGLLLETGCCGFGLLGSSGLYPTRRVDSGRGLV